MEKAIFCLTGAQSYTSKITGQLRKGETMVLPAIMSKALPPVFTVRKLGESFSWPVRMEGGIGDKIYALPAIYAYDGKVGAVTRDAPLLRMVKEKIRDKEPQDANVFIDIGGDDSELIDQIADRFGVLNNLGLRLPVLETSVSEKEACKNDSGYVVMAFWASSARRSWPKGLELEHLIRDREVRTVVKRHPSIIPMVERADCVISVNTSLLPIAGALQVPIVSIDAPFRTSEFMDVVEADKRVDDAMEKYHDLMLRRRLHCWCSWLVGRHVVIENLHMIECSNCGTLRQDVKLSEQGLNEFYVKHYHAGWRELVEKQTPYEDDLEESRALATERLKQWKLSVKGRSWLEVGCGNGALVDVLLEEGADAEGIEPDGCVCIGTPLTSKKEAGLYDRIAYVDVLEHMMCPVEELLWARDHLCEGGKLVVEVPLANEEPRHYRRLQHLFFFTPNTLKALLLKVGLKVVRENYPLSGRYSVIAEGM